MIDNIKSISATPGQEDRIQFADSHRVALEAGDYTLEVTQSIQGETWTNRRRFAVRGERFFLPPSAIQSVFPPAGSRGSNFWHVIPHVVLDRSTLPWERSCVKGASDSDTAPPWLALLVFHPDAVPEIKNVTLQTLLQGNSTDLEGQNAGDTVQVITVEKVLLLNPEEMEHLTHVRRRLAPVLGSAPFVNKKDVIDFVGQFSPQVIETALDEPARDAISTALEQAFVLRDPAGDETFEVWKMRDEPEFKLFHVAHEAATLLANRLPVPGRNIVHLVRMEEVYQSSTAAPFTEGTIDLVTLFHWEFYCEDEKTNFTKIMGDLDKKPWGLNLAPLAETPAPPEIDPLNQYLKSGYTPLRHRFREGSRSVSWYHGPMIPIEGTLQLDLRPPAAADIRQADELVVFNEQTGMFDVSYAAAWELGRLLTLQQTSIALALYNWKREHAQNLHALRQVLSYGYHFAGAGNFSIKTADDKAIVDWLDELRLLRHIPFNYLVPDPRLLPPESIRFFRIDETWLKYLADGAFSIGEVLARDAKQKLPDGKVDHTTLTGFLLRSVLVSGWPNLQMTAYKAMPPDPGTTGKSPDTKDGSTLLPVRKEKLAADVMLVLFADNLVAVDFFLPPETLHFGFDEIETEADQPTLLKKALRNPETGRIDPSRTLNIQFRNPDNRTLDIKGMLSVLETGSSGHSGTVALQLTAENELFRLKLPVA